MMLKILAAVVAAAAIPVLAQSTPPVEPRQARVEVSDPAGTSATASQKASKPAKSTKTAKKTSKKKAKKKPQPVG